MFQSIEEIIVNNPSVDNSYEDIDAGGYGIPSTANGVLIRYLVGNSSSCSMSFRCNGSTDDIYNIVTVSSVAYVIVALDANGIFEVKLGDRANTTFYIIGFYYGDDVVFYVNQPNISLTPTTTWTDIDIDVDDSALAAMVHVNIIGGNFLEFGLRKNGSTDNRHNYSVGHSCHSAIIGLDVDEIFEGYIESTNVDFYLIGYLKKGTYNTNATNISLSDITQWVEIDGGAGISGIIIEAVSTSNLYGASIRAKGYTGISANCPYNLNGHQWMMCGTDEFGKLEGWIENANVDFYYIGSYGMSELPAGLYININDEWQIVAFQ